MADYIWSTLQFLIGLIALYTLARDAGKEYPAEFYSMVYIIFFVFTPMLITYSLLILTNETTFCGKSHGVIGSLIDNVVKSTIDIKNESVLLVCIFLIAYIPPISAYLCLGFFGVAQWKSPLRFAPKFIVLSLIKFAATLAGVVLSATAWRAIFRCSSKSEFFTTTNLFILTFIVGTFILYFFLERLNVLIILNSFFRLLYLLDRQMTRNFDQKSHVKQNE